MSVLDGRIKLIEDNIAAIWARLHGMNVIIHEADSDATTVIAHDLDGSSHTGVTDYTSILDLLEAQVQRYKFKAATALTLASDAVTLSQSHHTIDTEASAASDNLATVNGLVANEFYLLRPANDARTIVVKHGTGNIKCEGNADFTLDDIHDFILGFTPDGTTLYAMFGAGGGGGSSPHDLLDGSQNQDTLAGSVADGDTIIGNATPKWSRLAITVPAANILEVLGVVNGETRPSWKAVHDGTNPAAISTAASPGTALTAAHRDHVHAHEAAHVAHDTIWDAKGDAVYGTGADTAAKVSAGVDGQILVYNSASTPGVKVISPIPIGWAFGR